MLAMSCKDFDLGLESQLTMRNYCNLSSTSNWISVESVAESTASVLFHQTQMRHWIAWYCREIRLQNRHHNWA